MATVGRSTKPARESLLGMSRGAVRHLTDEQPRTDGAHIRRPPTDDANVRAALSAAGRLLHELNNHLMVTVSTAFLLIGDLPAGPEREAATEIYSSATKAVEVARQLAAALEATP